MKVRRGVVAPTVSGLRTRYVPKNRINQGLVSVAPWLDVILVLIMFVLFNGTLVLHPGVVMDMPTDSFRDGTKGGMPAVVLSVKTRTGEQAKELVFFDDERFQFDRSEDMTRLKSAFRSRLGGVGGVPLVIHADARVEHGTIMNLVNMAGEAGVSRVNVASKPTVD
ncbi:MAG: biopolymer transporter ExbD [Kiritimatiellae bacterium]|nr:biopolymer transporter ExbD [Kiritimatiellia bacterium]